MKRPLPWRTIIPSRDTGRFTPEQLEQAVLSVMRQAETVRAGRPMIVGERGPAYGSPRPADPATAPEPARGGPPDGHA